MPLHPALTWAHLFPAGSSFDGADAPAPFLPLLDRSGPAGRVLVASEQSALPALDRYDGLVALNRRDLRPAELRATGFRYVRRFAIVPNLAQPRWFVPLDHPAVASGAFCLYTPLRSSARLKYCAIRAVARSGLQLWYRDHLVIAQREVPPVEQTLQAIFPGLSMRLSLSAGPISGPDAQRKAAIGVLSQHGRPVAFGKVAGSETAAGILRHEARTLPALAERLGAGWEGPRLLFEGEIDGTYMTFQSPVRGRRVGPELTAAHHRFLALLRDGQPVRPSETHLVRTLHQRLVGVPTLRGILDRIDPILAELTLPRTIVHGDFLPWNQRVRDGRVLAFDWENSDLDGVPLVDEVDQLASVGDLVFHWSVERAAGALSRFLDSGPLGLRREQTRSLAGVSLLNHLARLLELGHQDDHPQVAWNLALLVQLVSGVPAPDRGK